MELRNAERKQAKIKMGLQAPSGAGKTYSALLLAYGLINDWSKIAVIDTENHSADLYAHLGNYQVLAFEQPFSPERYIQAIEVCEKAGMEVIILDSISHEWEGVGGILDIHGAMMGNSFTNWAKVTPRHNAFVQKLLQSSSHIIATIRSKQDYVLSEKNGKMVPEKIGLKGVTREGLDYEFTIVLELDLKHQATATKDRTQLFMDKPSFIITPDTGKTIKAWCESGAAPTPAATSVEELRDMVRNTVTVEALTALYRTYPETSKLLIPEFNKRKQEIVNSRIVTTQNFSSNGNDTKNG
ncbi:MAG: AAA family ATPase [Syntrophorhabdus sp.]